MLDILICTVTVPLARTAPGALSVVAFSHIEEYRFCEALDCEDAKE